MSLEDWLDPLPLVAILRGVRPEQVVEVGGVLIDEGFRIIEVPLNSPDPLVSIERLAASFGERALIGAGTVLAPARVAEVADAGGRLVVMPHGDVEVIRTAVASGLLCTPGIATPTEAFAAIAAGATALKLFPAEMLGPPVVKAMKAVLPPEITLMPVGGIAPDTMQPFVSAGARGFGLGSALYKPGMSPEEVGRNAARFASAWKAIAR